jgi:tetratricopeptide (TPR) repeat protein
LTRCAAALLLVGFAAATTGAEQRLILVRHTSGGQGGSGTETPFVVTTRADGVEFKDGGVRTVLLYPTRRHLTIEAGAYRDHSRHAVVAFREMELENRRSMREVLAKSGLRNLPSNLDPVRVEHELGVTTPDERRKFKRRQAGNWVRYALGNEEFLAHTVDTETVAPALQRAYLVAIRERLGGHPQLLEAVASLAGVPRELRIFHITHGGPSVTTLKFVGTAVATPDSESGAGAQPEKDEFPFADLLRQASAATPAQAEARATTLESRALAAIRDGAALTAMLAIIEHGLTVGPLPIATDEHLAALEQHPDVQALRQALKPEGVLPKDARETLERLREAAGPQGYLLDLFQANLYRNEGNASQAEAHFRRALESAPLLTGAWKDLGEYLYFQFETGYAWRCWDAARAIAPAHPMLQPLTEYEAKLVERNPDSYR